MPFSRRKRTAIAVKMRTISRAKRSTGTAGWAGWLPRLACHCGMRAPPGTTGARLNHTLHTITPAQRTSRSNHAPAQRAICTDAHDAGTPHNGHMYHRSTTSTGTTGMRFCDAVNRKNGVPTTLPSHPTGCRSAAASASPQHVKIRTILCAQRSAGTAGWAGWLPSLACRSGMTTPHGTTGGRWNHTPHPITPAQRTRQRQDALHNEPSVRAGTTHARRTTSVRLNHTLHPITSAQRTRQRQDAPHNERSVRAGTTPARRTTSLRTTAARRACASMMR